MENARPNLFLRNDTMFGVCQGIGEDFGFNPNWLRIALALAMFAAPVGAVVAYFALGVVVLASRLIAPVPKAKAEPVAEAEAIAVEVMPEPLPLAA